MKTKILIIIFILISFKSNAQNSNIEKMESFANHLKAKGEYYRAITEYMRINNYFPENRMHVSNLRRIAECYEKAEHYKEAIGIYKSILNNKKNDWRSVQSIAKSYNNMDYFYESNQFINMYLDVFNKNKNDTLLSLSIYNDFYLGNYDKIDTKVRNLSNNNNKKRIKEILNKHTPLKYKSRTKAGILALLVPGGGYLYTGKYETALAAFTLNSLLGWATYNSFKNEDNSTGITFGVLFISFHFGSVYGSLQSTDHYNKHLKLDLVEKVNFLKNK